MDGPLQGFGRELSEILLIFDKLKHLIINFIILRRPHKYDQSSKFYLTLLSSSEKKIGVLVTFFVAFSECKNWTICDKVGHSFKRRCHKPNHQLRFTVDYAVFHLGRSLLEILKLRQIFLNFLRWLTTT